VALRKAVLEYAAARARKILLAPTVFSRHSTVPFSGLPTVPAGSLDEPATLLRHLLDRLAELDVLAPADAAINAAVDAVVGELHQLYRERTGTRWPGRAEAVTFRAGVPAPDIDRAECWRRLVDGVAQVAEHAAARGVPGLTLALDTGHCLVSGRWALAEAVRAFAGRLGAVAIEDMPWGRHEHRAPGEGDMDFPAVFGTLRDVDYRGLVCLELSRDAHRADTLVPAALAALRRGEMGRWEMSR
jgi:sugar phosphate isomerase/epimerase